MKTTDFSSLPLNTTLLDNLASLNYRAMTPIQAEALPTILAGKDLIGQSKTGSGKTAAFALGLLSKLDLSAFQLQSLVLCPTRELAEQVANEIRRLARTMSNVKVLTLCGGAPIASQIRSLNHGAHIVVGTPGRIEEHIAKNRLMLESVTTLVLDEADRMLDMGFQQSVEDIIDKLPQQRQTLLFSATYPEKIEAMVKRVMVKPLLVKVASTHDRATIEQHFYQVSSSKHRLTALRLLLLQYRPESALLFCNTKKECQQVADRLHHFGFSALALHGDLEQKVRDQALMRFANRSTAIVVATDVAARGLDIDALEAVINYQVAHDPQTHLHRIGRTGRAGSQGAAYTLYDSSEACRVALLEVQPDPIVNSEPLPQLNLLDQPPIQAAMATVRIGGGKKQKLRPGDILGALTGEHGIAASQVGKIHLLDHWAYVAIRREVVKTAVKKLARGKLKGRSFRVLLIGD